MIVTTDNRDAPHVLHGQGPSRLEWRLRTELTQATGVYAPVFFLLVQRCA